ncbi:hydroxylamine reductase [Caldichromatium japonicum]|uniref:Hydroxylamine reductase n=2 Tax=Caldichromatium japonicum TaxID=2699430 RepID=A0A6G7VGY6_9GAMM|nr:hydroxylamine reductase [Caldichromatium japonicum]
MFCFQCEETSKGRGCTHLGICGKHSTTAQLQDLLIYLLKGLAVVAQAAPARIRTDPSLGRFIAESLFMTVTNVNFDDARLTERIEETIARREALKAMLGFDAANDLDAAQWSGSPDQYLERGIAVGILAESDEDVRALRELLVYGLKGLAAYLDHAAILGFEQPEINAFMIEALAASLTESHPDVLLAWVLRCGAQGVVVMALLDSAHTSTFGNPELTRIRQQVGTHPGILISGHDLKDLAELLEQTQGTGIDVYTHGEMLPAHAYPAFKQYPHLVGHYGHAWWQQDKEFAAFNGAILMTTNCLIPIEESYRDRIFTTGQAGWPGVPHIADRPPGGSKDFSPVIARARTCSPPTPLEQGELITGFAHAQLLALAEQVLAAVQSGAVRRLIVMGGCDGRHKQRAYYTELAQRLPQDTLILTAGCAKYRFNGLELGEIAGIPRLLDAGQCNDAYSLAYVALKLKEVLGVADINDLPIAYDIAWYEQKAVIVLLALLALGVKHIRLGPTLPAFLSPKVVQLLAERFDLKPIRDPETDIQEMLAGA